MSRRLLAALLLLSGCATTSGPAGPRASESIASAHAARKEGKTDEALAAWREAVKREPENLEAWRGLVQLHAETGRLAEIQAELETRLKESPKSPALHHARGLALFARTKSAGDEAVREFEAAGALAPTEPEHPFRAGIALLETERFESALPRLQKAAELGPKVARYRVPLGICQARLGKKAEARAAFAAMVELGPTGKEVEAARRTLERLDDPLRAIPQSESETFQRGLDLLQRADAPQQAVDLLREILVKYPDLSPVHVVVGLAFQRMDESANAIEHLRRAMELAPEDAAPRLYLGLLYASRQRTEQAKPLLTEALERNPLLDEAHARLGAMALDANDAVLALRHFRAMAALRPDDPAARKQLAQALEFTGAIDEAERVMVAVADGSPRDLDAQYRLGVLYLGLWKRAPAADKPRWKEKAAERFQKVLDIQPENVAAGQALQSLQQ